MPIALDPNRTFDVVLKTDQGKPKNKRPAFVFRYLTVGEWQRVLAYAGEAELSKDMSDMMTRMVEAIQIGLVNWKHMKGQDGKPIPFDAEKVRDLLTFDETTELLERLIEEAVPKDNDLGK